MLSNVEAKCVLWVLVYNEPESKTVAVWKKERKVPSVILIIGPLQNRHGPYRICWLASLRTRSTSFPLCSSSLVRVSMVSFREWISWSRSVMRLLREHTSACRSEIRASSSCSCTHGKQGGPVSRCQKQKTRGWDRLPACGCAPWRSPAHAWQRSSPSGGSAWDVR